MHHFSRPCLNGGTCTRVDGQFTCACVSAFNGRWCERSATISAAMSTHMPFPTPKAEIATKDGCLSTPCQYSGQLEIILDFQIFCVSIDEQTFFLQAHAFPSPMAATCVAVTPAMRASTVKLTWPSVYRLRVPTAASASRDRIRAHSALVSQHYFYTRFFSYPINSSVFQTVVGSWFRCDLWAAFACQRGGFCVRLRAWL